MDIARFALKCAFSFFGVSEGCRYDVEMAHVSLEFSINDPGVINVDHLIKVKDAMEAPATVFIKVCWRAQRGI